MFKMQFDGSFKPQMKKKMLIFKRLTVKPSLRILDSVNLSGKVNIYIKSRLSFLITIVNSNT